MDYSSLFIIFIFGTLVGSFLNVIALRYNTGLSMYRGRSKCFSCSKKLSWYELVPLFSFLAQKGKCRSCKSFISLQYPIIEFLTGVVFVLVALRQYSLWSVYGGFTSGLLYSTLFVLYYCIVFSILIVIAVYDIRHKIIPNSFVYTFIFLGLCKLAIFFVLKISLSGLTNADILDVFSPLILSLPFATLWYVSHGRWIGFGDAKLAFGIGALLGLVFGASSIVLSFWIGAIYGVALVLRGRFSIDHRKKVTLSSEVPFAPFMILAVVIVFFWRVDFLSLSFFINLLN